MAPRPADPNAHAPPLPEDHCPSIGVLLSGQRTLGSLAERVDPRCDVVREMDAQQSTTARAEHIKIAASLGAFHHGEADVAARNLDIGLRGGGDLENTPVFGPAL